MTGFPQLLIQLVYILFISLLICIPLWSAIWAARDADARGRPGWLVGLLVLLLVWPLGLIIWLLIRAGIPAQEQAKP